MSAADAAYRRAFLSTADPQGPAFYTGTVLASRRDGPFSRARRGFFCRALGSLKTSGPAFSVRSVVLRHNATAFRLAAFRAGWPDGAASEVLGTSQAKRDDRRAVRA